ncbi:sulfotransferase family protein [Jatrophihabitans sp. YIM 134969]
MFVFGVGLNKTGTTSLAAACKILGFRTLHHHALRLSPAEINARLDRAAAEQVSPFRHAARLRTFRAFFDVRAVSRHFDHLDRQLPGSKFVLHTRDVEAWLDSRAQHVARNAESGRSAWTAEDREASRALYERQTARVTSYFADRPGDLLTIDVTAGQGWDVLCPFLGVPVPDQPFPFANRAPGS